MNRTAFLTASATLVAASRGAVAAAGVPGGTHRVERRADFDADAFAKAVGRDAQIRQLWEAVAFKPTTWNNVKNSMNGLQFGFGYPAGSVAMVFAAHGPSASYGYADHVWKNYRIGEYFDLKDGAGAPVTSNVYLARRAAIDPDADPDDDAGMYQDTSIEMLQQRGLIYLTCHTAVEEQARGIVKKGLAPAGMTASDVADDILTHLIPGARVVPSMVATVAVLQATYRYTYITLTL
ncbi:MAG: hypothetical protein ABI231_01935 [Candidatus Tumulicola sp.]